MSNELSAWWELARVVEHKFIAEIRTFTNDMWKEDTVTINLLRRVRDALDEVVVEGYADRVATTARLFKADGSIEERYGDAAILVRIDYRDGHTLNGVAFYEAKLRHWTDPKIPEAKKKQLQKMHSNLWNGHLVIFDRERVEIPVAGIAQGPLWWEDHPRIGVVTRLAPVTNAITMPLGPVLQSAKLDTSLYKFGTAWSSQIVLRNLQGLDLDHDEDVLEESTGYADKKEVPKHVLAVGVKYGPGTPTLPDVNIARFTEVDADQRRRG
jgi:hypothetical protein